MNLWRLGFQLRQKLSGRSHREWIVIQELKRTRTAPRPKLKVRESGYSEKTVTNDLAGPAQRSGMKAVAGKLGMAILKASPNVLAHAKP